jgi:hypothetical protein
MWPNGQVGEGTEPVAQEEEAETGCLPFGAPLLSGSRQGQPEVACHTGSSPIVILAVLVFALDSPAPTSLLDATASSGRALCWLYPELNILKASRMPGCGQESRRPGLFTGLLSP